MSRAYLDLAGVTKSYDGISNAVHDVSISIRKGEFVSFLGPSGSGKTTTLAMIAGFEEPTRGSIMLADQDLVRLRPWQRNIGMVFQNYALFPHMTVERNVAFPLKMRRHPRAQIDAKVREVIDLVGLGGFAQRYPRELSGGQQQRVALARGLVFSPDVLLLDEPLGALDKNLREQMQVEIKRIHREVGITMVYVTHDQTEAMTMSDRIAVFSDGRLEQADAPLDVYHRPQTRFVGEFVGDSNFMPGRRNGDPAALEIDGFGPVAVSAEKLAAHPDTSEFDLLIRPERMRLVMDDAGQPANVMEMRIDTVVNYGDTLMVIGIAQGRPLRMRMAGDLVHRVREGADVRVAWEPTDAHLIPRAAGARG